MKWDYEAKLRLWTSLGAWIVIAVICFGVAFLMSGCSGPDEASFGVIKKVEKLEKAHWLGHGPKWKITTTKGIIEFKDKEFGFVIAKERILGRTVMMTDASTFYIRNFNGEEEYSSAELTLGEKGIR